MKSLKILVIFLPLVAMQQAGALDWEGELQLTISSYDDRNPDDLEIGYPGNNTLWLFWDRELEAGRQIFMGQISWMGQFVPGEQQFTNGPGENYLPRVAPQEDWMAPRFLSWEHSEGDDRDIQFAYFDNNVWSDPIPVFDSEADEYGPWSCLAERIVGDTLIHQFVISAQQDSVVLLRMYEYDHAILRLVDDEEWVMPGRVSHVTCDYFGYLAVAWQVTTDADTQLYYRQYAAQTGWEPIEIPETGTISAFAPMFRYVWIYFQWHDGDILKYGHLFRPAPGHWILEPNQFPGFVGNQIEYVELLVSDINGNLDIFDTNSSYDLISLSESQDQNPCLGVISYYDTLGFQTYRHMAFWESYRNDNWDIYVRLGSVVISAVEPPSLSLEPQKLGISVYPNPGNAQFRISLDLPIDGMVKAAVYDLTGRRVAQIQQGLLTQGVHLLTWEAAEKPSGIYLLRVESGGSIQTEKIVLMK